MELERFHFRGELLQVGPRVHDYEGRKGAAELELHQTNGINTVSPWDSGWPEVN